MVARPVDRREQPRSRLAKGTATRYQGPAVDFAGFRLVEKDLERRFKKGLPQVIFL